MNWIDGVYQAGRVIGNCLWVLMDDDGTEWSGGKAVQGCDR